MEHSRVIPCTDCDQEKQNLQYASFIVLDCKPDPANPGFCIIRFRDPLAAISAALASRAAGAATALRPSKGKKSRKS